MTICGCKISCPILALVVSAIVGVLAAFFQITGVITVTPAFLWVVFGIAVVYLAVLAVTTSLRCGCECARCVCAGFRVVLVGLLGSVLLSVILLAVGIIATSILNAIAVGLLLFFFSLTLIGTACYVNCLNDCE